MTDTAQGLLLAVTIIGPAGTVAGSQWWQRHRFRRQVRRARRRARPGG